MLYSNAKYVLFGGVLKIKSGILKTFQLFGLRGASGLIDIYIPGVVCPIRCFSLAG